ncbi:hypothetical protein AFL01nite_25970 [Aeromicrobium flavum]|uniref:Uncharacterized protein n=2 Tax=Aeromicrobium flavum TaxID=416568 RepID=A0A512HY06_9ACTN|nr:hypothetical protein AFL01nite_25970 [Aeromicrobium flavum]
MCGTFNVNMEERGGVMHQRTRKIKFEAAPVPGAGRGYRVLSIKIVHSAKSRCRTSTWSACRKIDVKKWKTFSGIGPHVVVPSYSDKWGELSHGPNWTGATATVTYQYGTGKKQTMTKWINHGTISWW